MTTDIVPAAPENAPTVGGVTWEQILPVIRQMYARGCTDPEFELFVTTARKLDLDPQLRQIWAVKNENRPDLAAIIMVGRDGYLAIAHRSGQFDGMESGFKKSDLGDVGWCRVFRKDMTRPFYMEVLRSEYDTAKSVWKEKPMTMTIKVAESQCFRRAFQIEGVYSPEEFDKTEYARQAMPASSAPVGEGTTPADPTRCSQCGAGVSDVESMVSKRDHGRYLCSSCMGVKSKPPRPMKEVPDTSRPASTPAEVVPSRPKTTPAPQTSTNAEVSKPINSCQIDTSAPAPKKIHDPSGGDPTTCGGCGCTINDAPGGHIVPVEGVGWRCIPCRDQCKQTTIPAEEIARPLPPETAPASPKAVPTAPPKVPAPKTTDTACEICGRQLLDSEAKTSRLMISKAMCKTCLQGYMGDPAQGARS